MSPQQAQPNWAGVIFSLFKVAHSGLNSQNRTISTKFNLINITINPSSKDYFRRLLPYKYSDSFDKLFQSTLFEQTKKMYENTYSNEQYAAGYGQYTQTATEQPPAQPPAYQYSTYYDQATSQYQLNNCYGGQYFNYYQPQTTNYPGYSYIPRFDLILS